MKKLYLLFLFSASATVTGYGGLIVFDRVDKAHQVVTRKNALGEPKGRMAMAKETIVEAFKGTRPAPRAMPMGPDASALPGSAETTVAEYDKRDLEELKREGIDLECVSEIRTAMRRILTDPDPEVRMRIAVELKRKFGLAADPGMLAKLERVGNGDLNPTWTEKGRRFVWDSAASVYKAYLEMLEKLTE